MERIADHPERAVERLPSLHKSKATMVDLVRALVAPIQSIEDVFFALRTLPSIDDSEGVNLDAIGRIVGQDRANLDDATYRVWLKARQQVNRSSGTVPELLAIARAVVPAGVELEAIPGFPAGFVIRANAEAIGPVDAIAGLLRAASAAGVLVILEYSRHAPAETFRFGSGPGFGVGKLAGAKV